MLGLGNTRRLVHVLALAGFSLYAAYLLLTVAQGINKRYQWDFKSHYCAAQVHELGLNFYDEPYLRHYCSPDASQYYSYTPLSIWFFRFFSLFPFSTAYSLFLALKALALAALFFIWVRIFLKKETDPGFFVFSLLAFNGALFLDLRAGNVSLFEQLGLWIGFFFLLKKKPALFGACVVLAATFKVVPLIFLALLLLTKEKKKALYFGGSLLAFAALHGLTFVFNPFLGREFFRVFFSMLRERRGISNPSGFLWLQEVVGSSFHSVFGGEAPRALIFGLWAALSGLIVLLTWKALSKIRKNPDGDSEKTVIFLFCLAYALFMPRFKDYSYILLLVPSYFALKRYAAGLGRVFLFVLAGLSVAENTSLPGFAVIFRHFWNYFPLFTASVFWALFLRHAFRPPDALSPSSPAT
ncbi:MAG: DUF2029 domain-containing protein [Candidatus Aminicenantes bacterium]|nr:DUF2029 domain-containing protein [Candidatus Aminicenantes bacterium]